MEEKELTSLNLLLTAHESYKILRMKTKNRKKITLTSTSASERFTENKLLTCGTFRMQLSTCDQLYTIHRPFQLFVPQIIDQFLFLSETTVTSFRPKGFLLHLICCPFQRSVQKRIKAVKYQDASHQSLSAKASRNYRKLWDGQRCADEKNTPISYRA